MNIDHNIVIRVTISQLHERAIGFYLCSENVI